MRLAPILLLAGFAVLPGCAIDRPRITTGADCAACGMKIEDLRFACARRVNGRWLAYDAIECLLRDSSRAAGGASWLSDYDRRVLRPADSLWVVKGQFPSPMGGGFAAFSSRDAADSIAEETRGQVDRYSAWVAKGGP